MGTKDLKKLAKKLSSSSYSFYICNIIYSIFGMYRLYDKNGVLRFANSDREACLDYAKLFELNSAHCCLMNLVVSYDKEANINLDLNQVENNN